MQLLVRNNESPEPHRHGKTLRYRGGKLALKPGDNVVDQGVFEEAVGGKVDMAAPGNVRIDFSVPGHAWDVRAPSPRLREDVQSGRVEVLGDLATFIAKEVAARGPEAIAGLRLDRAGALRFIAGLKKQAGAEAEKLLLGMIPKCRTVESALALAEAVKPSELVAVFERVSATVQEGILRSLRSNPMVLRQLIDAVDDPKARARVARYVRGLRATGVKV